MPYSALPSRAYPYHTNGTVVKLCNASFTTQITLNSSQMSELNDIDYDTVVTNFSGGNNTQWYMVFFFPENVVLGGVFAQMKDSNPSVTPRVPLSIEISDDSTNGIDGTWATCTASGGYNTSAQNVDSWRSDVKSHTSTTNGDVLRIKFGPGTNYSMQNAYIAHIYAKKATGETPDDILFLDAENSDTEFTLPLDFGDQPAGTTVTRQIKLKNDSATLTANSIDVVVNSTYFTISDDDVTYSTTVSIASLAAGAKSGIIYVRCETPTPPTDYKPVRDAITVTVDSWS